MPAARGAVAHVVRYFDAWGAQTRSRAESVRFAGRPNKGTPRAGTPSACGGPIASAAVIRRRDLLGGLLHEYEAASA
jgi:hypothetical protein